MRIVEQFFQLGAELFVCLALEVSQPLPNIWSSRELRSIHATGTRIQCAECYVFIAFNGKSLMRW